MSPITSTEHDVRSLTLPATPGSHFKLALIAAALRVLEVVERESALSEFSFLAAYANEAVTLCGGDGSPADLRSRLQTAIKDLCGRATRWLPLAELAEEANVGPDAMELLLTIGLIEEDPRFGAVFEWAQPGCPGQQRPTRGLLTAWRRDDDDCSGVRAAIRQLCDFGLINVINPEVPRLYWAYEATPVLWDVLRGDSGLSHASWLAFHPRHELRVLDELVLLAELRKKAETIPTLLNQEHARGVIVRGPMHNGRKTMLRAIAGIAGFSALEVHPDHKLTTSEAAYLGTLCIALHALPIMSFELAPGETASIPQLGRYQGTQLITLSRHGSIEGDIVESSVLLESALPHAAERRHLWAHALGMPTERLPEWTERVRLTSGRILRSVELGRRQAMLEGHVDITHDHIRKGSRALQQPLESQAKRIEDLAGWQSIVSAPDVMSELHTLAERCRFREQLAVTLGQSNSNASHGVKALFGGPSGTGKTLAARVLAAELQLDLYRLDLSAIVNKYIGETEKNLNHVLSRAEELNIILLLDEGDSLLTNRTAVQSSNDRYANLETNFLLQRIESFEGILLITTNALHRIDSAFQRRMDVLVEFRMPEPEERRRIWHLHLPADHEVSEQWSEDMARRCNLSGGQLRNAALHASLLSLGHRSPVTTTDAECAIFREYQKIGATCPLRRTGGR